MSKSKTKRTLVFDLDGTLETPYFDKEAKSKVKAWMKRHPSGNTFDRMYAEVMEDKLPQEEGQLPLCVRIPSQKTGTQRGRLRHVRSAR